MKNFEQTHAESVLYRQIVDADTITNSAWSIAPSAGTTVTLGTQTTTETNAMVSGLTSGTRYVLTVLVTLASGQILERSANVRCP